MTETVYRDIQERTRRGEKLLWVLLDPDDATPREAGERARTAEDHGAHAILVGGSLMSSVHFDEFVLSVRDAVNIPVLLFPGDATQISAHAHGVLFLTLLSGRNPNFLIGEQLKGAPRIRQAGIEPMATAYLLVESGNTTSVEFMSNTKPLPRDKPDIAAMHALAAEYMGQKLLYLEAGSGAHSSVPPALITAVRHSTSLPLIVGGGLRSVAHVQEKLAAGADIIVTGTVVSEAGGTQTLADFARVVREAWRR
ncbi:geranylgeranylglyceryl/heptaprenylglyceryl phosphate synthase [Chitinivibrio alkaliphilus]|uniref:Phosphoglycerol geranylgeranyltransferase n=1 Tax=Chitinivibrio alkaliphilus ACht1 TaxID=1313304 RepID=U7DBW8_9BACT|nr:geranylgeranylglyceryl/heptaprenylglyceryl phosphate synthase [Chitinivibrio alkaliphilus]ERP39078.1 geranylgeranylglyceryl phosphate synthase-like protein [Chitinivibrio alkaliphilus ACht1]